MEHREHPNVFADKCRLFYVDMMKRIFRATATAAAIRMYRMCIVYSSNTTHVYSAHIYSRDVVVPQNNNTWIGARKYVHTKSVHHHTLTARRRTHIERVVESRVAMNEAHADCGSVSARFKCGFMCF